MKPHEVCERCRFWNQYVARDGKPRGECRVAPPRNLGRLGDEPIWPVTMPDDWCGQFADNVWEQVEAFPTRWGIP